MSQRWQHDREMRQIEFEAQLETIQESINTHNANLAAIIDAASDDDSSSITAINEYIHKATVELDEAWQFHKSDIFVGGKWYRSQLEGSSSIDGGFLSIHMHREEALQPAVSLGFGVYRGEDSRYHKFGLTFAPDNYIEQSFGASSWGRLDFTYQPYAFAEPQDVTLQYMGENGEERVSPADLDEIYHTLASADALHQLYTTHPGSSFYRLSAVKQQKYLERFISPIYDTLPVPESLTELNVHAAVDKIYKSSGIGKLELHQAGTHECLEIYGEVVGFTALDTLVARDGIRKINSPREMVDSDTGVCVAVIDSDTSSKEVIYIPYRNANTLDFSLQ